MRERGLAEGVSDVVLNCSGGIPTAAGQPVPHTNILLFSSPTFASSRQLEGDWSEALLLIDEPDEAHRHICGDTGTVEVSPGVCDIRGTGSGVGVYDGSAARPNVFQAKVAAPDLNTSGPPGGNAIIWYGVPLDEGTHTIRLTNIRVQAPPLGNAALPTQIFGYLTIFGRAITSPVFTVLATVAASPVASVNAPTFYACAGENTALAANPASSGTSQFSVRFTAAAGVLKKRSAAPFIDTETASVPIAQTALGAPLTYETMFYNPSFPSLTGRGNLGLAGRADRGTKFYVQFYNIPSGVQMFVPETVSLNPPPGAPGSARTGLARLTVPSDYFSEGNSYGLFPVPGAFEYEVLDVDPTTEQEVEIPIYIAYTANVPAGTASMTFQLAPNNPTEGASATAPIPRFTRHEPLSRDTGIHGCAMPGCRHLARTGADQLRHRVERDSTERHR